jgi:hypothetical protein
VPGFFFFFFFFLLFYVGTKKKNNILYDSKKKKLCTRAPPIPGAPFIPLFPPRCLFYFIFSNANRFPNPLAVDEVIALGYRENVSPGNIRTYLAMESAAEQKEIADRKEKERVAAKTMKERAASLDKSRAAAARLGAGPGSATGFGSDTRGAQGSVRGKEKKKKKKKKDKRTAKKKKKTQALSSLGRFSQFLTPPTTTYPIAIPMMCFIFLYLPFQWRR